MKRRRRLCLALVSITVLAFVSRTTWLPSVGNWLIVSAPTLPAHVAVPLPGGNDTRPFAVAALFREGWVKQAVVLTNPVTPAEADGTVTPMHEVTRHVLLKRGVPRERILMISGASRSTMSDMQILAAEFANRSEESILIVTDPHHTRRAQWTAKRVFRDHDIDVSTVATINDRFDSERWWESSSGIETVIGEYLKLAFYVVLYAPFIRWAFILIAVVSMLFIVRRRADHKSRHERKTSVT